jgi:hypothetical protein
MKKTFKVKRKDGTWGAEIGLTPLLATAADRITRGDGPFMVARITAEDGRYRHPDLKRSGALEVFKAIAEKIGADAGIRVEDGAGDTILRCERVARELYKNPLRDVASLREYRQDMGVDYACGSESPIYAIGPGEITRVDPFPSGNGWPWDNDHPDDGAIICYRITEGPAKGVCVYLSEHVKLNPNLKVGDKVEAGTRLGTLQPGFANCEMGWADSNGFSAEARSYYHSGDRTAHGANFGAFMKALGAPVGLFEGRAIRGTLPAKYPKANEWKALLEPVT